MKLIGTKDFYKTTFAICIPMMLQMMVTNFVSLLDNLMVGRLGTFEMSAVSISNQLLSMVYLICFALSNSAGIFFTQFAGKKDKKGMKNSFRLKLYLIMVFYVLAMLVFSVFKDKLILLFLQSEANSAQDIAYTLSFASRYTSIMLIGLLPFMLNVAYSFTLKENGETVLPMISSIIAVVVNLVLNYLLIFGEFGFPKLGVEGAAIATVISRFVEVIIVYVFCKLNKQKAPFADNTFESFKVPFELVKDVMIKGAPLVFNELLYTLGETGMIQSFSTRGIEAVAAVNIMMICGNLLFVSCVSMGNTTSILIGQSLGRNEDEKAVKEKAIQLTLTSFVLAGILALVFFNLSSFIPNLYETSENVKLMASSLIRLQSVMLLNAAISMSAYFTLRSGGNTALTLFFDGGYSLVICYVFSFFLSRYTSLSLFMLVFLVRLVELPKSVIGIWLILKSNWAKNIVDVY